MLALEASGLNVHFAGLHAVRDVSLGVQPGEIVGLIGPNGAGKTTVFNSLSGSLPCQGTVCLGGHDVSRFPPHRRARHGLGRTFQRLEVFGSMSVFDNIRTAAETCARWTKSPAKAALTTDALIERLGLGEQADRRADSISTGQARLVEIGRALATQPKVLLLDEAASGLDEPETLRLADVLVDVARDGVSIVLIEHDIELVMKLCARIYVLNFGEVIAVGTPGEIQANQKVRDAYLGLMA